MNDKRLGKIEKVTFGIGGYQDAMLGLHITFSGSSYGVSTSICFWDYEIIPHTENTKWTPEERDEEGVMVLKKLSKCLSDAKVKSVDQLKGVPVELVFDHNTLKSWRVLTEVL